MEKVECLFYLYSGNNRYIEVKHMTKQTALITGVPGGVGKAFAEIFAKNGFNLVAVARSAYNHNLK